MAPTPPSHIEDIEKTSAPHKLGIMLPMVEPTPAPIHAIDLMSLL
jgi:hypothetical protein